MSTIKKAFEIQSEFSQSCTVRNGWDAEQGNRAFETLKNIAALAAFIGWDKEVFEDNCSDGYEAVIDEIESLIPDAHLRSYISFAYELCGNIVESNSGTTIS